MADGDELPQERRARLKAARRERKTRGRRMAVAGKSVFVIKQVIEERARKAREKHPAGNHGRRKREGG